MLRHVALVRTDVSEERMTSIIRVTRIGELGTMLAHIFTRAIQCNIPEDRFLLSFTFCLSNCHGINGNAKTKQTNSVALSPQANYTD
jgi:hypothetical protein